MAAVLTEEGQRMWDNITVYASTRKRKPIKLDKIVFDTKGIELAFIKCEMEKLIHNSELVIEDCDKIMNKYATMAEYIASEPKIAKTMHQNFIERLKRVLSHIPAFEDESHLTK